MTASISLKHDHPPWQHASAEEYTQFVHAYTSQEPARRDHLRWYERFVQCYPDLHEWFRAPLRERVGCVDGETRQQISYRSRTYLKFLALRGNIQLDWDWLIAVSRLELQPLLSLLKIDIGLTKFAEEAVALGYTDNNINRMFWWVMSRLSLHTTIFHVDCVTDLHVTSFAEAIQSFGEGPNLLDFFESYEDYRRKLYHNHLDVFHRVLYHRGQLTIEPRQIKPRYAPRKSIRPQMEVLVKRYVAQRQLTRSPDTAENIHWSLLYFISWLAQAHPSIATFAELKREHILEFAHALDTTIGVKTKRPLTAGSKTTILGVLSRFFTLIWRWGWDDAPNCPLFEYGDVPKRPRHVPRYIPEAELSRLMPAIRALDCPFQRAALLIARWSGARRNEIHRLPVDCLDTYPDGTPRLRIPVGKTYAERLVPLNEEAAEAIREVQRLRQGRQGYRDSKTGAITHYLFMHHGKLFGDTYLFDGALEKACAMAGLLTPDDKRTIYPHRFRHTVATQLADRGAKMHTIMKILGHDSVNMTIVYACISDAEVRKDYDAVLGPGATIAGPSAELLLSGTLSEADVHWLKTNFFKTALELGHCLRLPQEGPCECDLYLNCAKFVTTREYAPQLRRRRTTELTLIEDASSRGWQREVERHQCTVKRIEQLLFDLNEPIDGPEAVD